MNGIFIPLVFAAALGSGLIAGVFFVFSIAVMRALDQLSPAQAIAAMQSINTAILNPTFFGTFVGTGVICILLPVAILTDWSTTRAIWMFIGMGFYLIGSLMVTIVFNVTLNNRLATIRPDDPQADAIWRKYSSVWTRWNHVRGLSSFIAALAFIQALR